MKTDIEVLMGKIVNFPNFCRNFYFQPYYSQTCVATIKWRPSCKIVVITLEILISKFGLNIAIKIARFEVLGPLTNGRLFRCYAYRPRIVRVMMASNFRRTRGIIASTGVAIVRIRIGFYLSGVLSVMRNHPRSDRTLLTISTRHFPKIGLYWFKIFPRRFSNSALNRDRVLGPRTCSYLAFPNWLVSRDWSDPGETY